MGIWIAETDFNKRYDVAIVGAGIVGCSTAFFLGQQGLSVVVCDRGKVGGEQSSRAWGFIRKQGRHVAELPLAEDAIGIWDQMTEKYGFQSTRRTKAGIIMPAETEADEEILQKNLRTAQENGTALEMLTPAQLADMLPELRGGWRSALFAPGDGHADPETSIHMFHKAALEHGVDFATDLTVTGLPTSGSYVIGVQTSKGVIRAGTVVVAGGIGSQPLLRKLGYNPPIQVIRSSVVQTTQGAPFTDIAMWCPKVAFRPNVDGSFVVGNGYRNVRSDYDITLDSLTHLRYFLPAFLKNPSQLKFSVGADLIRSLTDAISRNPGFDPLGEPRVNQKRVDANLAQFNALFPQREALGKAKQWAGRIDVTPDLIPIIDQLNPHENVFVACGFSGHGFALGPAIGKQLCAWIVDGSTSLDLTQFKHTRYHEGDFQIAKAI